MRPWTTPLLSHCPICGRGEIGARSRRSRQRSRQETLPCPTCGAVMSPMGNDLYKLRYCAPHRLGNQGCKRCAGYFYNVCFLDRALPLSDWERMANQRPPIEVEEYLEASTRMRSGDLPIMEAAVMADQLMPGEVVHYLSYPVFVDDLYRAGRPEEGGRLIVTNRRLLHCTGRTCSPLDFESFEELAEERPGFYVRLRGEQVPRYFFPPSLDPVFSAVAGALKNFRNTGKAQQK